MVRCMTSPAHHSSILLWGCECPYPFMFSIIETLGHYAIMVSQ